MVSSRERTRRGGAAGTEEALRELHAITVTGGGFGERVEDLLRMGCRRFGLPIGILSRARGDEYRVEAVLTTGDPAPELGSILPVAETFCDAVLTDGAPVRISHASDSEWKGHPAIRRLGWEAYVGCPVTVDGRLYGTLCFGSLSPRDTAPAPDELSILELMAQWAGGELARRRATDRSRRQAAWLSALLEVAQDALIAIDGDGRITRFNPAAEEMFGYRADEVRGRNVSMLMAEPYATQHDSYIQRYREGGQARAIGRIRTVVARRRDGEEFPIELSVAEIRAGEEEGYGAFIRDVSDRTRLQDKLLEQQRLAAIGTTAAKLAHEIGNPLNNMYLNAQLMERSLEREARPEDDRLLPRLRTVLTEIRRLRNLLEDFRSASREQRLTLAEVDLAALVQAVCDAHAAELREHLVEVDVVVSAGLPRPLADEEKIKQVLVNLCRNAVQAMPGGGRLSLHARPTPRGVALHVRDTGVGIPPDLDVFEPFATTRPEGTGLGLPIVRQLVQAHGGSVSFETRQGVGTTFVVELPLRPPGAARS